MKPISDLDEALALIDSFRGEPDDFSLCLAEALHDPIGLNIAIVTDRVLARGWEPLRVESGDGFRVYRYKVMAQGR